MPRELCPGCHEIMPNVGPWNEPPGRLCGGCKIKATLARPGAKERLEEAVRQALVGHGLCARQEGPRLNTTGLQVARRPWNMSPSSFV